MEYSHLLNKLVIIGRHFCNRNSLCRNENGGKPLGVSEYLLKAV